MLDQDTSYRITRSYYIQGTHNGDFLGDKNIEAHHGDDESYKVIRIMINESYNEVKNYEDKGFILDYVKMKVRSESIRQAKKIKSEENKLENFYTKELDRLNNRLSNMHSPEILEEIDIAKRELEKIQTIKTNGAIVRSKMIKLEEGEKNSAYFL